MRYLPLSEDDRAAMLRRIGVSGIDELFVDVPAEKRLKVSPGLPPRASEIIGRPSAPSATRSRVMT